MARLASALLHHRSDRQILQIVHVAVRADNVVLTISARNKPYRIGRKFAARYPHYFPSRLRVRIDREVGDLSLSAYSE